MRYCALIATAIITPETMTARPLLGTQNTRPMTIEMTEQAVAERRWCLPARSFESTAGDHVAGLLREMERTVQRY
jgi:hypothetical protein